MARHRLVALLLAAGLAASACASTSAFRAGRDAERNQDYDRAVVEYTKALRARPDDRGIRAALDRAKLRAAEAHFLRGRRLAADGRYEDALLELQVAAELHPASRDIDALLRETRNRLRTRFAVPLDGKTELEALIERTQHLPAADFELPDVRMPDTLVFRDAGSRDVFLALARLAGINLAFDPTFRDAPVTIDLRRASLEDALTSVARSTGNFYRVTSSRTVTVIPDTPAKRREYDQEIVRTFFLSNADLREALDLLRIVIDARRIAPVNAANAISIRDSPERIAAAARILSAIDKARPEVVIEVELLEVDRTRLLEYGLQVASPPPTGSATGISGSADVNRPDLSLRDLRSLTQADVLVAGVPALYYRLLKSDANTRILANPRLRTSEGLSAQARFGERVPVPVTTFAPIATGGVAQQPITSFNYENIGVNIDITPRTHHNDDVSLALAIEVSSISGIGFGGLPTFGNRAINTTIRLRDGETNMLAGLIRDDERQVLAGVPGLSDVPIVGRLFAHTRRETQETDIILTLTPHIVRVLDLTETDLRPFRVAPDAAQPFPFVAPDVPGALDGPPDLELEEPAFPPFPRPDDPDAPAEPILPPPDDSSPSAGI